MVSNYRCKASCAVGNERILSYDTTYIHTYGHAYWYFSAFGVNEANQGCQMVCFRTKNTNLSKFCT
jgi:hypothetical protein